MRGRVGVGGGENGGLLIGKLDEAGRQCEETEKVRSIALGMKIYIM